jgi:hypothetical protein
MQDGILTFLTLIVPSKVNVDLGVFDINRIKKYIFLQNLLQILKKFIKDMKNDSLTYI